MYLFADCLWPEEISSSLKTWIPKLSNLDLKDRYEHSENVLLGTITHLLGKDLHDIIIKSRVTLPQK